MNKKKWTIIGVVLFVLFLWLGLGLDDMIAIAVLVGLIFLGIRLFARRSPKKKAKTIQHISKEKEQHYKESGMSQSEITLFRETMSQTKELIDRLQKNINQNAKLKSIDLRYDTVRASKALFKDLVKHPKRLHLANHFLYTHLPNLVELTDKYLEINIHEIKSKETYVKMEESILVIDQMAALIAKDYQNFVAEDFDEIDVELSLAKQSIQQQK
ncbi:5-bromo-4-chloroindolyl phosphate hydrolysis family protein [Enterococcus bulliens]